MKLLLIRFSSFGDVTQTLSVVGAFARHFPGSEIHWVTRQEFGPLIETHPDLTKVWTLKRQDGFLGLVRLALLLRKEHYTHVYDAHNNLRSHLLCWFLRCHWSRPQFLRKSQKRWKRFLLFQFRINLFEQPFSGQRDLLEPLQAWGISKVSPAAPQFFTSLQALAEIEKRSQNWNLKEWICLAPSAAFPLKRWPISHWRNLIQLLPKEKFIILGGPEDHFLKEISKGFENQVHLQMGSCSFQESAAWIQKSKALISNDTGLLHVAEQLGHPTLALMGPAPFGFPSRTQTTTILQKNLDCRPCSKHGQGPCTNPDFHACMQTILPEDVLQTLRSRGLCL